MVDSWSISAELAQHEVEVDLQIQSIEESLRSLCKISNEYTICNVVGKPLLITNVVGQQISAEKKGNIESEGFWILNKTLVYQQAAIAARVEEAIFTKTMVIKELTQSTVRNLSGREITSFFIDMRALIEQIAVFNHFVNEIKLTSLDIEPSDEQVTEYFTKWEECLLNQIKGTRIDWLKMSDVSLRDNRIDYKPKDGFRDLTASNILKSVDKLNRVSRGARRAYDFCCEFTHPNSATHHVYTSKMEIIEDKVFGGNFTLVKKTHSPTCPIEAIRLIHKPATDVLTIVSELLVHFMSVREGFIAEEIKAMKKITRTSLRRRLRKNKVLFSSNEYCPCGSTLMIRMCCGNGITFPKKRSEPKIRLKFDDLKTWL